MNYESLSPSAQTAYADLLDALLEAPPPDKGLSYFKRPVRGRDYWYVQQVVGSGKRSFYLGPDDARTRALVETVKARGEQDRGERPPRERLVATGVASGLWAPTAAEARVYDALAQAGVFAIGGAMVGTHGFLNIGNALGVHWPGGLGRTEDLDVAHDPEIQVATEVETDFQSALSVADAGFIPVPGLDPRQPSTAFKVRGKRLSVSLLAPERGKPDGEPIAIPALKAAAQPLRYLDYLLEDSVPAAVPVGAGVLVRVPDPARFAIHKLVVSQRRPAAFTSKSRKDLDQAAALLEALMDLTPGRIDEAWSSARGQGHKFVQQARQGLITIVRTQPALRAVIDLIGG
jgi:hypothetical protein